MLVAAIVLALYFWAYFADVKQISSSLLVDDITAIFAGVSFVIGFVSYLWAPKKYIFAGALVAFAMLCAMAGMLILNTGGTSSPFIALWMIVSVFAGVFGFYGLVPLFLAVLAYMITQYTSGALSREAIVAIVLAGELPLVVSYIIWHTKNTKTDTGTDKAYRELATEFSQVSGKSDAIINAIGDGVISLSGQGIIQLLNPAAQQIIGWGSQDAVSLDYKSVLKLVDKNDNELTPANDPISMVLATNKEVSTNNLSLLTHSGKKILVSVTVSPVGQAGAGVIVVFRDITKEKAEEREQAEFISTASHEMRTPVASIEGYLGLALNPQTAQIDEKARDFIKKAHESAQHLGRLFQDLLDVSKAEDGRLSNNPKIVDVVSFTHDIVSGLQPKAEEKGLRMLFKPQPDDNDEKAGERRLNPVYYANVDNDHLREVLSNLIENAIKYTPKGDVTIDIGGDGEHVVVSVADSGIGIPKEDQVHLFQKFYRVDNTATREIGGTGLGLYLSRRLVEGMNGRIWLESEFQRGSTFFVEIPRVSHEEATRLIEAASIATEQEQVAAPPTPPTPMATRDAAFNSPPTAAVAQQLQAIRATPVTPQTPPLVQHTYQAPLNGPRPNIPLASIEQNPSQYARSGQVAVPPRSQNQP
jgi:PAS domain S-box-containing protein